MSDERVCKACGAALVRRPGEDLSNFRKRVTCSQSCAHKSVTGRPRLDLAPRKCIICGRLFRFDRRNKESTTEFQRRKTCSRKCRNVRVAQMVSARYREPDRIRNSPYPIEWRSIVRKLIRERDQHTCQLCGATPTDRAFPVHHIDYVKGNICPDNLITLCHSCHPKTNHDRPYWHAYFVTFMAQREDVEVAA